MLVRCQGGEHQKETALDQPSVRCGVKCGKGTKESDFVLPARLAGSSPANEDLPYHMFAKQHKCMCNCASFYQTANQQAPQVPAAPEREELEATVPKELLRTIPNVVSDESRGRIKTIETAIRN